MVTQHIWLIHRRVQHPAKPKPYSSRANKRPSIASPPFPQNQYLFVYVVTHTKHNTQIHIHVYIHHPAI